MKPSQSIKQLEIGRLFISSKRLAFFCNFFELEPSAFFNNRITPLVEKDLDYISEIKRQLPLLSSNKLKEMYEILLVIKNND